MNKAWIAAWVVCVGILSSLTTYSWQTLNCHVRTSEDHFYLGAIFANRLIMYNGTADQTFALFYNNSTCDAVVPIYKVLVCTIGILVAISLRSGAAVPRVHVVLSMLCGATFVLLLYWNLACLVLLNQRTFPFSLHVAIPSPALLMTGAALVAMLFMPLH